MAARGGRGSAIAALAPLAEVVGASVFHPPIGAIARGSIDGLAIHVVARFLWE